MDNEHQEQGIVSTQTLELDFQSLLLKCIDYWRYDAELAEETILKYQQVLGRIFRDLKGVTSPLQLRIDHITELKKIMKQRGVGPAGINSAVFALRKLLTYCRDIKKLKVLDPKEIMRAKDVKREIVSLIKEEIIAFLKTMNIKTIRGLRMRALCQLLLSTGMRISEALSLNRNDLDWERGEVQIIGKGNKQRTVFLTKEAGKWIRLYLEKRKDDNPALFVTIGSPKRLRRYDMSKQFKVYARKAGVNKKVTPQTLRRTFASILVNNGSNLFAVQQMLGHADIKTTSKYYISADKEAIKAAHKKYLSFS